MYGKLYGQLKDKENLQSVLDDVRGDLKKVRKLISADDRRVWKTESPRKREATGGAARRPILFLLSSNNPESKHRPG